MGQAAATAAASCLSAATTREATFSNAALYCVGGKGGVSHVEWHEARAWHNRHRAWTLFMLLTAPCWWPSTVEGTYNL